MLRGLKKQKNVGSFVLERSFVIVRAFFARSNLLKDVEKIVHPPRAFNGQVSLEFTFCMIVVLIMIYGVMRVFQWTGRDLAERRIAHERVLADSSSQGACKPGWVNIFGVLTWVPCATTVSLREVALNQIDPYFYTPVTMNAVWNGT